MKIVFVQDNALNESLALTELSGYLKSRGHQTDLFLGDEEKNLIAQVCGANPDVVIMPCSVLGEAWCFETYRQLKAALPPRVKILVGGTYPTFYPEMIETSGVEILWRGEAELAVEEFLDKLGRGEDYTGVANFSFNLGGRFVHNPVRPLIQDLSILPRPDRELYYKYGFIRDFKWKKFSSGRGCVHRCSYCYNQGIAGLYGGKGQFVRRKSPEAVVDEVAHIQRNHPISIAHFSDDLFTVDLAWLEAFTTLYKRTLTLPFSLNTSAEQLTRDKVRMLKDAGATAIAIGVETGNEALRKRILNKHLSNELLRTKARLVKDAGLKLVTFNMLAFPGETIEDAISTLTFNEEIGADYIRMGFAVPIPHTEMADNALKDGLLDPARAHASLAGGRPWDLREPVYAVEDRERFIKLYYLSKFYAVAKPSLYLKYLDRLPLTGLLNVLELLTSYNEKQIYGLEVLGGLRYYRHSGPPNKRTTNYVSLI